MTTFRNGVGEVDPVNQQPSSSERRSFEQWVAEGESLYAEVTRDLREMEAKVAELQTKIREKRVQVEQIARMLGKTPPETPRPAPAQHPPTSASASNLDEALRIRIPYSKPAPVRAPRNPGADSGVIVPLRE